METAGERKFVTTAQWQHRKQVGKMWTSFASVPCPAASSASWKCSINKRKKKANKNYLSPIASLDNKNNSTKQSSQ